MSIDISERKPKKLDLGMQLHADWASPTVVSSFRFDWAVNQAKDGEIGGEEETLREWNGYTPDGRRLVVRRENEAWVVTCDGGEPVRHELLDLALIEAIRDYDDVSTHSFAIDYGEWTRRIADAIQRSLLRPG